MKQEIHYCTASDGVRLAYSIVGAGTPIVRTPHWFAHLEHDLTSSAMRHMLLTLIKKAFAFTLRPAWDWPLPKRHHRTIL